MNDLASVYLSGAQPNLRSGFYPSENTSVMKYVLSLSTK